MAFSAPKTLLDKWNLFVKYGATEPCVFQSMDDSEYVGGTVTKPILSSHSLDIVFDALSQGAQAKFQISKADESAIRKIDKVTLFPALALPVAPKVNDLIVDSSLVEWEVKGVAKDPVKAHYELWVRPIK